MDIKVTRAEIDRLIHNQKSLFDAIQEPILLIKGSSSIEYFNASGLKFFKNIGHTSSSLEISKSLSQKILHAIHETSTKNTNSNIYYTQIDDFHLKFVFSPFKGHKGDQLHWVVMQDITDQRKHEEELSLFHTNIEAILSQKIKKLKESERIRGDLTEQINSLKSQIANLSSDDAMIGSSRPMRDLRDMISQVAKSDATILITGESGTGKELVANMIRETSARNNKPFLKINCNTINDSLLESDLFGYEKGAFTGAHSRTKGKFEVVDGGTLFLDEIGDITPRMQAALLRVLQDGEIIRVGGNSPIKIDVRIIAATNRDLALEVQEGNFRLDLFYRLNIINISIPPLRERKEDIEDLVSYFVRRYRLAFKKEVNFVPKPIIDRLKKHHWPGNVRELENVIQRAVLMTKSNIITDQEILFDVAMSSDDNVQKGSISQQFKDTPLKEILAEVEREVLTNSLKKFHGNVSKAAKELKIGKTAFYDKLKRFGISSKEHR